MSAEPEIMHIGDEAVDLIGQGRQQAINQHVLDACP